MSLRQKLFEKKYERKTVEAKFLGETVYCREMNVLDLEKYETYVLTKATKKTPTQKNEQAEQDQQNELSWRLAIVAFTVVDENGVFIFDLNKKEDEDFLTSLGWKEIEPVFLVCRDLQKREEDPEKKESPKEVLNTGNTDSPQS